jgi:hypothetical protein
VPDIQRLALANPAQCLRMPRISSLTFMFGQYVPKAMQFPVFSQKMLAAQMFRVDVPNAHIYL